MLIVFDDMLADMISNKKINPIVTETINRGKKLNVSLAFYTQSHFKVPENVTLNSTHYFIMKIPNKRELQQEMIHLLQETIHLILTLKILQRLIKMKKSM